jgi:hypothetical protein
MAQAISDWTVSDIIRQNEQRRALGQAGMTDSQVGGAVAGALEEQYRDAMSMAQQTTAARIQEETSEYQTNAHLQEALLQKKSAQQGGTKQLIGTIAGQAIQSSDKIISGAEKVGGWLKDAMSPSTGVDLTTTVSTPVAQAGDALASSGMAQGASLADAVGAGGADYAVDYSVEAGSEFAAEGAAIPESGPFAPIAAAVLGADIIGHTIGGPIGTFLSLPGALVSMVTKPITDVISKGIGAISKGCVTMTYVYGERSRENRYANLYCIKFMDKKTLLGYYNTGFVVVLISFLLNTKYPLKWITDSFQRYIQEALGRSKSHWYDRINAKCLFKLFRFVQKVSPWQYVPKNTCIDKVR